MHRTAEDETTQQSPAAKPRQSCCRILELRQYTLHPGKRDVLIELFDREFIETQEALGMEVVGQFRDLDDPDRFVWLRGFSDMASRVRALDTFYSGPVWKTHRAAANATMIDASNVLLLRPLHPRSEFSTRNERPRAGAKENTNGLVVATIYYFDKPVADDFVRFFENKLSQALKEAGASILAYFVTEPSVNDFPKLPVREGENVFVWFSCFRDEGAYDEYLRSISKTKAWEQLARDLKKKPEVLRLSPTARSRLRC